ncbi:MULTISPECIES: helix-turn-helix domain-containing protein [Xanthobacter]|uniref:helix-turn-helix domain-containing protein n=1 Tax=Xanthobacter TaxID=279 RepID=UPI001F360482|nr:MULTISPECIES: helix-turn-helix domain-containing protein [Xanthobacter]MCL8384141.1 helix-turn-helix domain-containing protein [Xanthobacter aminoxidans]
MAFKPLMSKSQTQLLLDHFRVKGSISGIEAQALYRIRSLSRRINDLEARGYIFARSEEKDPTEQRYTRYHFIGLKAEGKAA